MVKKYSISERKIHVYSSKYKFVGQGDHISLWECQWMCVLYVYSHTRSYVEENEKCMRSDVD